MRTPSRSPFTRLHSSLTVRVRSSQICTTGASSPSAIGGQHRKLQPQPQSHTPPTSKAYTRPLSHSSAATVTENPPTVKIGDQQIVDGTPFAGSGGGISEPPPEIADLQILEECRTDGIVVVHELDG